MSAAARARWNYAPAVTFGTVACVLVPASADAHLVTTGLGPIYDGISHVAMSPDDLIPALVMALLAGMNGAAAARRALFGLSAAWLLGGLAGFAAGDTVVPATAAAASFLVLGVLTAVNWRLSPSVVAGFAVAVGLLHGWLNGAGIAGAHRESLGLAGIVAAVFVVVAIAAAFAVSLRAQWTRIAVRVAGSWVAAIGLLMLGWSLRSASVL